MWKLLVGLAAGSALTAAVFLLFYPQIDREFVATQNETSPQSPADVADEAFDEPVLQDTDLDVRDAGRDAQESTAITGAPRPIRDLTEEQRRNLSDDELEAMIEATAGTSQYGRMLGERLRRERLEKFGNAPPPTRPITLPPEFAWLKDNPDPFHEQLQREAIDPDWSFATEAQIATFLAENPEISSKYGQPTVTCRISGCELSFVAYGVDETVLQVMGLATGQSVFWAIMDYPWAGQFVNPQNTLFNSHTDGNVTTILWHLVRDEDD